MMTFAQVSEVGERQINEDSVGFVPIGPEIGLFILADGLGGHGRGEDASALVTKVSGEVFRRHYGESDCLARCFLTSQEKLMQKQQMENASEDLKSTLVLLSVCNGRIQWGHVGDSRLYYFEDNRIVERTLDHSVPQMLVNAGEIKEKEIRHHPDRNRLLRVMGMEWDSPQYQLSATVPVREGGKRQCFLLCSDGFWENITEKQMESSLKKASDVRDWLRRMERIVSVTGKGTNMDNYSAVTVWMQK